MLTVEDVMDMIRDERDLHKKLLKFCESCNPEVLDNDRDVEIKRYEDRVALLNCLLFKIAYNEERLESKEVE